MLITVFTPVYNRAHLIPKLYESLLKQNDPEMEWVIVDDGSKDNITETVEAIKAENRLKIIFHKQENGGKHSAINKGVSLSNGELFFIVDSDDHLTDRAIQSIKKNWSDVQLLPDAASFAGVAGNRGYSNGEIIGGPVNYDILDCDIFEYRYKHKVEGDKAEVYQTRILKEYPFPNSAERFCTEALVWNRIGMKYKLRYFNETIYICEYLEGGLTHNTIKTRRQSPLNTLCFYSELANNKRVPFKYRVRGMLNFWRFSFNDRSRNVLEKWKMLTSSASIILMPLGYCLYLRDKNH